MEPPSLKYNLYLIALLNFGICIILKIETKTEKSNKTKNDRSPYNWTSKKSYNIKIDKSKLCNQSISYVTINVETNAIK